MSRKVKAGIVMCRLELLELTNEYVIYKYYPEGDTSDYGIIRIDFADRKRSLIKADNSRHSMYYRQAWYRVDKFIDAGECPQKAIAAWY